MRTVKNGGALLGTRMAQPPPPRDDARQQRLAAALRANLQRRKAKARALEAESPAEPPAPPDA